MISTLRFEPKGYVGKLSGLHREIRFSPGLTVLFGTNGSGKSTALRFLALTCGVQGAQHHGGWSSPPHERDHSFHVRSPRMRDVEGSVKWDGSPVYYHLPEVSDAAIQHFGMPGESVVADDFTQIGEMLGGISLGEKRLARLGKLGDMLTPRHREGVPVLAVPSWWGGKDAMERWEAFSGFKRGTTVAPTILMDEPDHSLSIPNQRMLWGHWLPQLAGFYQVIVASHSMLSLYAPGVTVVDLEPGYSEKAIEAVRDVIEAGVVDIDRAELHASTAPSRPRARP